MCAFFALRLRSPSTFQPTTGLVRILLCEAELRLYRVWSAGANSASSSYIANQSFAESLRRTNTPKCVLLPLQNAHYPRGPNMLPRLRPNDWPPAMC